MRHCISRFVHDSGKSYNVICISSEAYSGICFIAYFAEYYSGGEFYFWEVNVK